MVFYNMLLQALLSHGVITHAQYMNFIYMKNVINNCKTEHKGSVIAEVGSNHYNAEDHMTLITFIIIIIIIITFIIVIIVIIVLIINLIIELGLSHGAH